MYNKAKASGAKSWNGVESDFLTAMSDFDSILAATVLSSGDDDARKGLGADLQNGKGDFFNDLLELHDWHAATRFSTPSPPPSTRGTTWSAVRAGPPHQ